MLTVSSGCGSSTDLSAVWRDVNYTSGPIREFMIMGLTHNEERRRTFEYEFAERLKRDGVVAVPSLEVFPSDYKIDKSALEVGVRNSEIDAILVTRLVALDKDAKYTQTGNYTPPYRYYDYFYTYYSNAYDAVQASGDISQHRLLQLETSIYDTRTQQLVWSGLSESIHPGKADDLIDELADAIVSNLYMYGLIKKK